MMMRLPAQKGAISTLGVLTTLMLAFIPQPSAARQHQYVLTGYAVDVFADGARGDVPPQRVLMLPGSPSGSCYQIALDSQGYLYAQEFLQALVYVYAPGASGNATPVRVISGPATTLVGPRGVAVDKDGYLYVSDELSAKPRIDVFAPGANGDVAPVRVITGGKTKLSPSVANLTVSSTGHLFVQQGGPYSRNPQPKWNLLEFPPGADGNVPPVAQLNTQPKYSSATSVSVDRDNVYLSGYTDFFTGGFVEVFRLPSFNFIQVLQIPQFARKGVMSAAADENGNLHVLELWNHSSIAVFPPDPRPPHGVLKRLAWTLGGPMTGFHGGAEFLIFGP